MWADSQKKSNIDNKSELGIKTSSGNPAQAVGSPIWSFKFYNKISLYIRYS